MLKPEDCTHPDFAANVGVNRFEDTGKFLADITIKCVACGVTMRFVGAPAGIDFERPTVSITSEELHAPIEPAYVTHLHTSATFKVPQIPKKH